jgi:RNA polymerase sigma factor FliA
MPSQLSSAARLSTSPSSTTLSKAQAAAAATHLPFVPRPGSPKRSRERAASSAVVSGALAAAQEQLMMEHLPTVRYVARQIQERLPQHVEFEELLSAGTLGLIDASRKFDPSKNVQFRSYAQFRIRGAILDSLRTLDWGPRELRKRGRALAEATHALHARLGRPPAETEIAAELGVSLPSLQQLQGELKSLEISTLNAERGEESGEEELAFVPGKESDSPLFRFLDGEMRGRMASAIEELPERERLVMTLYYYDERTMKEIGVTLGVVESRVSQIHASAVRHLRASLSDLRPASVPQAEARTLRRSGAA